MMSLPTGTVTFLFTDIEGSTTLAQQFSAEMPALLTRHHAILRQAIEAHHGHIFQIIGDAFCAAFYTASDALQAALDAQRGLQHERWNPAPIKVRMGIHTGAAQAGVTEQRAGGYAGYSTLARTQRVMSVAHGGQVLLSNPSAELVRGDLPATAALRDMGEQRLKGLLNPEHLWQLAAPDVRQDFPPLPSLNAIPNNLPIQLTSFVGREKDIAEVKRLLSASRLVTLTGSGGAGKTRLSLQVAADVIDDFAQGVWFIDLAPLTDPALIMQTVASVLGLREESGRPLVTLLTDYLRAKTALIILDNCEHLIESGAQLAHHLLTHCPQIRILATSREVLQVSGEHSYQVPPLTLPNLYRKETVVVISQYEAVSLFIQRAKAAQPSFEINDNNAPAVAEICVRLDGLPLAIELAAARITLFAPQQLLQRLADRLGTVSGGLRDLPARQRTLRRTIDWSYDLLDGDEQTLFARLSVFQGGRSLEAAEAVCGERLGIEVVDGLESLIHKSLLRQVSGSTGEPRYVMLETIHEYARERLAAHTEANTIRARHVEYFAQLAERAELDIQRRWKFTLNDEQDNVLTALEWSLSGSAVEAGVRLATAIAHFWFGESRSSLNNFWTTRALQHQAAVPRELRARLLLQAGNAAWAANEMERARQLELQALDLFRELGDSLLTAQTLAFLAGTTIGYADLYAQARAWLDEALALARQSGDAHSEALALNSLGEVARSMDDYATAKKAYETCLPLTRPAGNRLIEVMALGNLSHVYSHEGDHRRAFDFAQQALQLGIEISSVAMIAAGLDVLASAIGPLGQPEKAARLYGASEALREELGTRIQAADLADYENGLAGVRAMLDPAQFDALWAEGRALEMEQAIEYALSGEET